jgi:hypothetical protein
MAFYLVSAVPKHGRLDELGMRLARDEFVSLLPFGRVLSTSLRGARLRRDGVVVWEEEDYCQPPLAQERAALLNDYFHDLRVESVAKDEGWDQIEGLPFLFPEAQRIEPA